MLDFTSDGSLEGNAQDSLGLGQVLRTLPTQITKEAMNSAQSYIPGAGAVASSRFQMLEECCNASDSEVLDGGLASVTVPSGDERQKVFDPIRESREGVWAEGSRRG